MSPPPWPFLSSAPFTPFSAKRCAKSYLPRHPSIPIMENILIGLIALALLVYLVVAVLRPEKF
jgi:K+-transporting ATPase KdpF subunit